MGVVMWRCIHVWMCSLAKALYNKIFDWVVEKVSIMMMTVMMMMVMMMVMMCRGWVGVCV